MRTTHEMPAKSINHRISIYRFSRNRKFSSQISNFITKSRFFLILKLRFFDTEGSFFFTIRETRTRFNKKSSAQITHYYNADNLVGKQVIGVCNFPKKNIAGIVSEVLILGAIEKDGKVVLVHPSQQVENGLEIA